MRRISNPCKIVIPSLLQLTKHVKPGSVRVILLRLKKNHYYMPFRVRVAEALSSSIRDEV